MAALLRPHISTSLRALSAMATALPQAPAPSTVTLRGVLSGVLIGLLAGISYRLRLQAPDFGRLHVAAQAVAVAHLDPGGHFRVDQFEQDALVDQKDGRRVVV